MRLLFNRFRGIGLAEKPSFEVSIDASGPMTLLDRCPQYAPTPLESHPELADRLRIGALWLKDERHRMGLGSFKALGAAYVIATEAGRQSLDGVVYVSASAGNHGMSLAAGARVFGAKAVVYLSDAVGDSFAARLAAEGAVVIREGATYEESVQAAIEASSENGWSLLSDSSWPGYTDIPIRVMEGYLAMGEEIVRQLGGGPATHIFLQAGVGGLAAALSAYLREKWGDGSTIVVVEPETAPALLVSIEAGGFTRAEGRPSTMGRLDCREPSLVALHSLARHADWFATITDREAEETVVLLGEHGIPTTTSAAAGVGAVQHLAELREELGLADDSRVLCIITEQDETPE